MIARCTSGLPGGPHVCPSGKSVKATLGGLVEAVIDRALVIDRVGTPFSSIALLISPTDWWQTGQTGTRRTASTPMSRIRSTRTGISSAARRRWE